MHEKTLQDSINLIIEKFIYKGEFTLSSGQISDRYIDCRAAMLTEPGLFALYLRRKLADYPADATPCATGAGGALMLGLLQRHGYLYNPKGHGVPFSPYPERGASVVLLDDVFMTGQTIDRLTEACAQYDLNILGTVVLIDRSI